MTIRQGHNLIGIVQVYRLPTLAVGNLQAAKGGSVVSLSSVEREGPAGGRYPQVYDPGRLSFFDHHLLLQHLKISRRCLNGMLLPMGGLS